MDEIKEEVNHVESILLNSSILDERFLTFSNINLIEGPPRSGKTSLLRYLSFPYLGGIAYDTEEEGDYPSDNEIVFKMDDGNTLLPSQVVLKQVLSFDELSGFIVRGTYSRWKVPLGQHHEELLRVLGLRALPDDYRPHRVERRGVRLTIKQLSETEFRLIELLHDCYVGTPKKVIQLDEFYPLWDCTLSRILCEAINYAVKTHGCRVWITVTSSSSNLRKVRSRLDNCQYIQLEPLYFK